MTNCAKRSRKDSEKVALFNPPSPGTPRRALAHALFSQRSDTPRTEQRTRRALTCCGHSRSEASRRFGEGGWKTDRLFEHPFNLEQLEAVLPREELQKLVVLRWKVQRGAIASQAGDDAAVFLIEP